jgi:hypothetical protein
MHVGQFHTDGLVLLTLLRGGPDADLIYAGYSWACLAQPEVRPRDWDAAGVSARLAQGQAATLEMWNSMMAYAYAIDSGNITDAGAYLDRAGDAAKQIPVDQANTPVASSFLSSFAFGRAPDDPARPDSQGTFTVVTNGDLSHNVGVTFQSPFVGSVPSYNFNSGSILSFKIAQSTALGNLVKSTWAQNKNSVTASGTFGPWPLVNGVNTAVTSIAFTFLSDPDLFVAFHLANLISPAMSVTVIKTGSSIQVKSVSVSGKLGDIYDFDYETPQPAPLAAKVQAGFGTLSGTDFRGNPSMAGNVRYTLVDFSGPVFIDLN